MMMMMMTCSGIWWRLLWCVEAGLYGVTALSARPDDLTRVTMKVKDTYLVSEQTFLTGMDTVPSSGTPCLRVTQCRSPIRHGDEIFCGGA